MKSFVNYMCSGPTCPSCKVQFPSETRKPSKLLCFINFLFFAFHCSNYFSYSLNTGLYSQLECSTILKPHSKSHVEPLFTSPPLPQSITGPALGLFGVSNLFSHNLTNYNELMFCSTNLKRCSKLTPNIYLLCCGFD